MNEQTFVDPMSQLGSAPLAPQPTPEPDSQQQNRAQAAQMAIESLGETPTYLGHIGSLFATCVSKLRAGDEKEGLKTFAWAMADLNQFIMLFDHLINVSAPQKSEAITAFRADLLHSLRAVETELNRQNYLGMCDQIEGSFLPMLPRWEPAAYELLAGAGAQYDAANQGS